ncbi:hypothetical protein GOODEAATRI_025165 [Goodea atripinnis]|uniref:Uncharacterized protein n=1 Tax=Goodea atripinnis TaxID=208336 RepID=A0ABV0PGY4_9TELE
MTSQYPSHGKRSPDKKPPAMAPKLHVQRSPSKEAITIHFSALGKKEEEEEEGLFIPTSSTASAPPDDSNIVTALEASEDMFEGAPLDSAAGIAVIPESFRFSPSSSNPTNHSLTQTPSSHVPEEKASIANSSPIKSLSFPSTLGLDSSSSSTSYRLPESRLNLQVLKQFAQSRMQSAAVASVSDSKTAPSSPLTSPDNRSFFKVSEVEARFEDTKRRLTEAISEPLQLLSKIMDEKSGGGIYRPKALSASATELSALTSANGNQESNNNYCIKEEDGGEVEAESPNSWTAVAAESPQDPSADNKSPNKLSLLSMSSLAKQEEEDFCILNNEDFEFCTDIEAEVIEGTNDTRTGSQLPLSGSSDPGYDDECEGFEPAPDVPHYTLALLTVLVYGCFVLPLPSYIGGMLLGVGLGFFLAIGVVWLTGPKRSGGEVRHSRIHRWLWNRTKLNIKEPEIYKVSHFNPFYHFFYAVVFLSA